VIVAELNMGQLRGVIREKFLVDAQGLNKIQGQPFKVAEVIAALEKELGGAAKTTNSKQPRVNA
jgi:2-oxoglutarate ferredoxin oxidoreductase subunit alpha